MAARRRGESGTPGPEVPVYVISVAAELTGLHPQTLRTYDRLGIVTPGRTGGGGRRYSWHDIEVLREVVDLTASGIGLEGVKRILDLERESAALRARNAELRRRVAAREAELSDAVALIGQLGAALRDHEAARGERLPVLRRSTVVTRWQPQAPFDDPSA